MKKKTPVLSDELDSLHVGVMALEELLVSKGIARVDELTTLIKKAHRETKRARKKGLRVTVA